MIFCGKVEHKCFILLIKIKISLSIEYSNNLCKARSFKLYENGKLYLILYYNFITKKILSVNITSKMSVIH